jgi:protein O-GlcNAc transferase
VTPANKQIMFAAVQHHQAGRLEEARAGYSRVLASEPNNADALHLLGLVAHQAGDQAAAVHLIQRAIQAQPGTALFHFNLSAALRAGGRKVEAIAQLERATALNPKLAPAQSTLGQLYAETGRLEESIAALTRALQLDPKLSDAYHLLGSLLWESGPIDRAMAVLRTALQINPNDRTAHSIILFTLYRDARVAPQSILAEHRAWAGRHAEPLTAAAAPHLRDPASLDRPLRIAYISPSFCNNPIGRFLLPLFESHDRARTKIVCYSDTTAPDATTARLRAAADEWHETAALDDAQLAQKTRSDKIDILIDLVLHAARNRLLTFARKPAPVQATYLAYPGTSGMSAMDWRLTDAFLDPPENDAFYSERSLRLESYWCYQSTEEAPSVAPLPALASGQVTFGCLNHFSKVSAESLECWTRILNNVPNSRLILHCRGATQQQRVGQSFAAARIDPSRLELLDFLPPAQYFQAYNRIDIGLDPFPYNGGTTTCDALWMGVPVVTLAGQLAVARAGVSLLSNVGLPQLIAGTIDQYVQIATTLASDVPALSALRVGLREQMRSSTLCNVSRCTAQLEDAYRTMWQEWVKG